MSSPGARQRRRRQQYQTPRTRRELGTAIAAGAIIVVGTALMIWLLRPGGLADRQPRSSWLVGLTVIAVAAACFVVLRRDSKVKEANRRVALAGSFAAIALVAVLAGVFWPKGIVRHTPTIPTLPSTPFSSSTTAPTGTSTSTTPSTTPSTKPGATTKPTTAPTTTIPSNSTTTKPAP